MPSLPFGGKTRLFTLAILFKKLYKYQTTLVLLILHFHVFHNLYTYLCLCLFVVLNPLYILGGQAPIAPDVSPTFIGADNFSGTSQLCKYRLLFPLFHAFVLNLIKSFVYHGFLSFTKPISLLQPLTVLYVFKVVNIFLYIKKFLIKKFNKKLKYENLFFIFYEVLQNEKNKILITS